jgi:hypothetical protein
VRYKIGKFFDRFTDHFETWERWYNVNKKMVSFAKKDKDSHITRGIEYCPLSSSDTND